MRMLACLALSGIVTAVSWSAMVAALAADQRPDDQLPEETAHWLLRLTQPR